MIAADRSACVGGPLRAATLAAAACAALCACGSGGGPGSAADPCKVADAGWLAWSEYVTTTSSGRFEIRMARADGSCARTVTSDPEGDLEPSLALARGALAFTGARSGVAHLVVRDLASGADRLVGTGPLAASAPALSPDGAWIAFQGLTGNHEPDLFVVPFAGGDPVVVATSAAFDGKPAWAPDGQSLYFVSTRSGRGEIYRAARDGSTLDPVLVTTPAAGGAVVGRPAVSPDGLSIAFPRATASGAQVVVRALATGAERVLADAHEEDPSWDATGAFLAVTHYEPTGTQIVVRAAATGALVSTPAAGPDLVATPAFTR